MKLTIPSRVLCAFTAAVLFIAAPFALATPEPDSFPTKKPAVNIVATNATTGYQEAPGVFTVTISEKQKKPITVLYSIKASHAENGVDYKRLPGMIVIKAGTNHALIRVVPTVASDSGFGFGPVDLTLHKGTGYTLGPDKEATVEISIVLP